MSEHYRISWEMVGLASLHLFSNADPRWYKNTTQIVPNSEIPDEHWYPISRETSDPWQQYNQLKAWADADEQFVRNVRLEKQVNQPEWTSVTPPARMHTVEDELAADDAARAEARRSE